MRIDEGKERMTRRLVLILVAMALAVTVLPATANAADRRAARTTNPITTDYEDAARMLDPYVTAAEDGTVTIDAPASVRSQIHPLVLARLEASVALASSFDLGGLDDALAQDVGNCQGKRGFGTRWWGWRYYMDSCQTSRLTSLLQIFGNSTALYCLSFGLKGFACTAFGLALSVLANSIKYIGGARNGIKISACWVCLPIVRRQ